MAERCPACAAHVDDSGAVAGGVLRCEKCGMRFPRKRTQKQAVEKPALAAKDDVDGLGIHPALARRYRKNSGEGGAVSMPGVSLPGVDAPPVERATEIEPARRMSMEARTPLPSFPGAVDAPRVDAPPPAARLPEAPPPVVAAAAAAAKAGRVDDEAGATPVERRANAQKGRPPPVEDPLPVVPGYDVMELLGKGAMGRVWKGVHKKTGGLAAIKVLAPELAARQDFIARFEREAAAIRAVNHPGVVAILDTGHSVHGNLGSEVHEPYFCMEYIEGQPLRRQLDKGPLLPERALHYARLIVQGLGAAHERGVIHRDLKPENILLVGNPAGMLASGGGDRLVLVDFGLAGIVDEEYDPHPNLTKSRMTMGTVNYMAPEQRTDAKRVDHRADLYAAGVILYELLTGDLPLGRFALPTERGTKLPPSIDRCIVTALARNPDERFQNAAELDEAIAGIEIEIGSTATLPKAAAPAAPGVAAAAGVVVAKVVPIEQPLAGPPPPMQQNDTPVTAGRPRVLPPISDGGRSDASSSVVAEGGEAPTMPSLMGEAFEDEPEALTRGPELKRQTMAWSVAALVVGTVIGLIALRGCDDAPATAAPAATAPER